MIHELTLIDKNIVQNDGGKIITEQKYLLQFDNIIKMDLQINTYYIDVAQTEISRVIYTLNIDGLLIVADAVFTPSLVTPPITDDQQALQDCYDAFKAFTP